MLLVYMMAENVTRLYDGLINESMNWVNESNQSIESMNRTNESNQWIESMNRINESNQQIEVRNKTLEPYTKTLH